MSLRCYLERNPELQGLSVPWYLKLKLHLALDPRALNPSILNSYIAMLWYVPKLYSN